MRIQVLGVMGIVGLTAAGIALSRGNRGVAYARPAASVTVSATTDSSGPPTTTFTITVSDLEYPSKLKDLHFQMGPDDHAFPGDNAGTEIDVQPLDGEGEPSGSPTEFEKAYSGKSNGTGKGKRWLHLTSSTGVGNGSYEIQIPWARGADGDVKSVLWYATNSGSVNKDSGGFDDGTIVHDTDATPKKGVPGIKIGFDPGGSLEASYGGNTPFDIDVDDELSGWDYTIYSSASLNESYTDTLEIGINSVTDPVLPAWSLSFSNFTGSVDVDGGATTPPSITVPNNPSLNGQSFYIVLALENGSGIEFLSSPMEVTIVAP